MITADQKASRAAKQKLYNATPKARAAQKAWRERPGRGAIQKRLAESARLMRLYGMTTDDREGMRKNQKDRCKICGVPFDTTISAVNMVIDHDHETGVVRGLLCRVCNISLGGFKDSPALLAQAIAYLTSKGGD